ncbi:hypothetical protein Nepgr_003716 [Nepenthes gracilis]|uniref:Uncharacterized protein n=1 Tax=Nepenthes gracilis TaxID=150966 RepID=A0AAD3S041_NEPGR|nr:hypothetical protein Nepgr_003716 [Nepenthes gracilis]
MPRGRTVVRHSIIRRLDEGKELEGDPKADSSYFIGCWAPDMMSATAMTTSSRTLLCNDFTVSKLYNPKPSSFIHDQSLLRRNDFAYSSSIGFSCSRHFLYIDYVTSGRRGRTTTAGVGSDRSTQDGGDNVRKLLQLVLWVMEGVYILWLFLLPYAPGDPVWAISSDTVGSLVGLSLNFFFILPLMNTVGIHVMNAPVLHPVSEGLFNFVIGWTLMFAPLLFSDFRRDRYRGSLDVLWGFQMFLTNVFLIPYMAIRLNEADDSEYPQTKPSWLGTVMIKGSPVVGFIGGAICLISILWAIIGRMERW